MLGKARLLLVEVDRHQVERHRRALAQADQDVEQRVAVLAARHADHPLVARLDQVEVANRLAHLAVQALGQLAGLEALAPLGLLWIEHFRGRVHRAPRSLDVASTSTLTSSQSANTCGLATRTRAAATPGNSSARRAMRPASVSSRWVCSRSASARASSRSWR